MLILFAHPAYQRSRVNRALVSAVSDLDGVILRDLYELYPEFNIDVDEEQRLMSEHDIIVMQHPFFWYSTPAILKEWQDLVLEHGWAYGSDGNALRGKKLMSAMTLGGGSSAYRKNGYNRFTISELLRPLEQTAYLCGMEFLPPFCVHGTHMMDTAMVEDYAARYRQLVTAMRDGTLNWKKAKKLTSFEDSLHLVIDGMESNAR